MALITAPIALAVRFQCHLKCKQTITKSGVHFVVPSALVYTLQCHLKVCERMERVPHHDTPPSYPLIAPTSRQPKTPDTKQDNNHHHARFWTKKGKTKTGETRLTISPRLL